jgi:hypothetical protein
MLLPDPVGNARRIRTLTTIDAVVTSRRRGAPPLARRAQALLRRVTTIDFGRVTYEADSVRRAKASYEL